ncbi:MAG: beta-galactosidase, partial [Candidatus Omnitrophota bacterium]
KRAELYWTIELAIPFSDLKSSYPEDNRRWGFNVGRERYAVSPTELSTWASLGGFTQRERFGKLVFYSKADIIANIDYWKVMAEEDPLMRRPEVSGYEIARGQGEKKSDLWTYDPMSVKVDKYKKWGMRGLSQRWSLWPIPDAKSSYPEFYQAAMSVNRALVAKSNLDDKIEQVRKAGAYYTAITGENRQKSTLDLLKIEQDFKARSEIIDIALNTAYQAYGEAFDQDWNKEKLVGLDARINDILVKITELGEKADHTLTLMQSTLQKKSPWNNLSLALPASEKRINRDGANERLSYTLHANGFRYYEPNRLLGEFDTVSQSGANINAMAEGLIAPGRYSFTFMDKMHASYSNSEEKGEYGVRAAYDMVYGTHNYWMAMPPWLIDKIKSNDDILLRSRDGLTGFRIDHWSAAYSFYTGVNPNNPEVMDFNRDYLKSLAAHASAYKMTDYFLTGWENSEYFRCMLNNQEVFRSLGYNTTGKKAFRDYLKERYSSIAGLNAQWKSTYASFENIEPPEDKFIQPPKMVSGLTYEFERWQRVNHARYLAKLKSFLKEGAPEIPVMNDPSYTLIGGSQYLAFKENTADIYSYHMSPASEEAMWVLLNTLSRKFGKVLAYNENYIKMYTLPHLKDERLAKREISKFFFTLFLRDIRYSSWWNSYPLHNPVSYIIGYGGGFFNIDYDGTIFRWSTTEYAPMYARGRFIEKALLESKPEQPKIAVIHPCSTLFNLASLGRSPFDNPAVKGMLDSHNILLGPLNYPQDYIPEEMVLDKMAALDDYRVVILPYAVYLTEEFSRTIKQWVEKGGTLIAVGPFGLTNEFGFDLTPDKSLFKTLFPKYARTGSEDWGFTTGENRSNEPELLIKDFGRGMVAYLNKSLYVSLQSPEVKDALTKFLARKVQRTAVSPDADLKILVREGKDGEKHLALCNLNVEKALATTVTVDGQYTIALDVVVPGCMPMPAKTSQAGTILNVFLDPGDWTYLVLKK